MTMTMLYTTLRLLRQYDACKESYKTLRKSLPDRFGQDEAIPLMHILHVLGGQDTVWALRALHPACADDGERLARLMACDFAERVLPVFEEQYPDDTRPRDAINAARRAAYGEATEDELAAAGDAAWAAAGAAWAAWATAWAAWAAGAAWDAQTEIVFGYLKGNRS